MTRTQRKAEDRAKEKRRLVPTGELTHPLFYLAQERAFAPGIVKEWPKVFVMPRLVPHGRAVLQTHEQIANELRRLGYTVTAPVEPKPTLTTRTIEPVPYTSEPFIDYPTQPDFNNNARIQADQDKDRK